MTWLRIWIAKRRLARDVERRICSYELRDYVRRREAALKGRANAALRASPGFHASHDALFHGRRPRGFQSLSQGGVK